MNPVDDHRDPEVDAAWRAASRDQPPRALDAAIAAAARRAVGAGPHRRHASRAWWPIAAAAVVAVVAIGIVEMTPPGEVAPTVMMPEPPQAPAPREPARQDSMEAERSAAPAVPERAPPRPAEAKRKVEGASPPVDRLTAAPAAVPQARQETAPSSANAQQAPAPPAEDARDTAPRTAGTLSPRSEPAPSNAPAALAKRAAGGATTIDEAQPRTVDEWIRLIRRLKAEGRNDLATKELAAFRARYQERAEALLPPDLRDAKP